LARGGGSVRGPASSTVLVFCNSGYHSVVAELPIEKLDNSSNGSLFQIAYSVVLSAIAIVGNSRGNRRNCRDRSEEERQWTTVVVTIRDEHNVFFAYMNGEEDLRDEPRTIRSLKEGKKRR
ncbi:unnamed protein product, partial [Brassica oleracea var. botrytis]